MRAEVRQRPIRAPEGRDRRSGHETGPNSTTRRSRASPEASPEDWPAADRLSLEDPARSTTGEELAEVVDGGDEQPFGLHLFESPEAEPVSYTHLTLPTIY